MSWLFCADVKTDAIEKWIKGERIRERDQSRGALQVGVHHYDRPRTHLDTVYSYGVSIAVRLVRPDGRVWFLLNGDAAGGSVTNKHMIEVRSAVDRYVMSQKLGTKGRCIVPFSAVRAAGLRPDQLDLLDTTGDIEITRTVTREVKGHWQRNGVAAGPFSHEWIAYDVPKIESHDYTTHTLGNSLFRATRMGGQVEYYVSGVDDTAAGRGVGYFLTRLRLLPGTYAPRTVARAFQMLKPLAVRKAENAGYTVLRQGDQFFIPADAGSLSARALRPLDSRKRRGGSLPNTHGHPSRHYASTAYPVVGGTMVTGRILHEAGDHRPLFCRGKWYLCVPNVQDRSWGATGRVD